MATEVTAENTPAEAAQTSCPGGGGEDTARAPDGVGAILSCQRVLQRLRLTLAPSTIMRGFNRDREPSEKLSSEVTPADQTVIDNNADPVNVSDIKMDKDNAILDLSSQAVRTDVIFDQLLQMHPQPQIVRELHLTGKHGLSSLPVAIGFMENLVVLNLRDNFIRDLPWSLVFLKKLEVLDLSYNMLTTLPKVIGHLSTLQKIDLEANHIIYLPTELRSLRNLQVLNLNMNKSLKSPPAKVCAKGVAHVFAALEQRKERSNAWEGYKPWICPDDTRNEMVAEVSALWDLCISVILEHKMDFWHVTSIPPVVKTHLGVKSDEYAYQVNLAKCTVCKKFYSSRELFSVHNCVK